uniref:ABC transporter permease n=1 Tax=Microbulbifer agarilyticus TaxID=260552 RepID=UPI000255B4A7|nr:ABC transporter permease [Microbulbifer agarilyticus]
MGLGTVFLSHYRRHPAQLLGLLLILVCAATLWSGVRALTDSAASAAKKSSELLEPLLRIEREDGHPLTVEDFATLRRAGLCVAPQLRVQFVAREAPDIIGIDPFTAGCLRQFRASDQEGNSESTADEGVVEKLINAWDEPLLLGAMEDFASLARLGLSSADGIEFAATEGVPRNQLFADISVAQEFAAGNRADLLMLLPAAEQNDKKLPAGYRTEVEDYGVEPAPLVDAFLLSLNALGVLTLLVAALLVRSVYRFALEQRRRSLDILVRCGIPQDKLRIALTVEVLLVALVGGTVGVWLGERLASGLADGFSGTLTGLFSVRGLAQSRLTVASWLGMVLILLFVVGWACFDLFVSVGRQTAHQNPFRAAPVRGVGNKWGHSAYNWRVLAGLLLVVVSAVILLSTYSLWLIFAATLGCLVGCGVLLPEMLNGLLGFAEHTTRRPLLEWSFSEMRALCRLLSLPLTALAFAIATAIGVQAMVSGFESTFDRWLDQRLQGDLYLDPGQSVDTSEWQRRLQALPGVSAVLPMVRGRAVLESAEGEKQIDVFAIDPQSPLLQDWPLLSAEPDLWRRLDGGGVLINEQLARRESLTLGDTISFKLGDKSESRPIVAIYADYGRPQGELMVPLTQVGDALPERYTRFVLGLKDAAGGGWRDWPEQYLWMKGTDLRDQKELKRAASAAFSRTFQLTRLLNGLTLVLAGTALALMGLVIFRLRQSSYTLLFVNGVPRRSLRHRLIAHSVLVTGLLAILAVPLGLFLSWVLVARVNPAAFGWALPLHVYPGFWLQVWGVCLLIGLAVGLLAGNPVRLETLKNE